MTRRDVEQPIPAAVSRAQRKAELIATIERQRIDILVEAERWRHSTLGLNAGWQQLAGRLPPILKHYRGAAYLAGGALLVAGLRHPRTLIRLTRQVAAGALLLHRARHLLGKVR